MSMTRDDNHSAIGPVEDQTSRRAYGVPSETPNAAARRGDTGTAAGIARGTGGNVVQLQTSAASAAPVSAYPGTDPTAPDATQPPAPASALDHYLDERTRAFVEPLRTMRALPDWIEDALEEDGIACPPTLTPIFDLINRQAQRLQQLAEDTARLERLLAQGGQARDIDIVSEVRDVLRGFQVADLWHFDLSLDHVAYRCDPSLFRQMLQPLVENACIHGAAPGDSIWITVHATEAGLTVTVKDIGCGYPEAVLNDPGQAFRACARAEEGGGSGLGLARAAAAAERLGGTFTLCNDPETGGATARIALPLIS